MKYITIGDKVTSIGRNAFYGCTALKIIYYTGSKEEWNKIDLKNDCIPSDAEIIYNATDCDINNGHSLGEWIAEVPATCTDDGVKIRRCGKCGETETRTTKAQGHKQGELVKHQNATCTKDGGDYYKCLTCGETYFVLGFAKNGHWFLDGECIDCGIAESDVPFDIDLDCEVSATDLTYLKRILLSNKTAECDPNGDGKLNILDLIALKKRLAKK